MPLFYLTTFSTSILRYSSSKGSLLLALNNAVNSIARIVMGILADRVGRQNTLVTSVRGLSTPHFAATEIVSYIGPLVFDHCSSTMVQCISWPLSCVRHLVWHLGRRL